MYRLATNHAMQDRLRAELLTLPEQPDMWVVYALSS